MSFLRQLGALLRKDILIRKFKRHYIMAVLEFVLPVIIWGTLIYTWSLVGAAFSIDGGSGPEQKYEKIEAFEVDDMRNWYDVQKIYFTPDNPYANNITKNIFKEPEYITKAFSSETDLRNALAKEEDDRILALQFAPQEYNHSLSYTMRWPNSIRMFTDTVFPEGSRPRIAGDSPNPGFMYDERRRLWPLMYGIFIEHLRYFNMESVTMPSLQALPTPAWKRLAAENLYGSLATMISGFIFGSFIIFLSSYSKNVMEDKETRLRELLRMMGLTDTVYWTNAFLVGLLNALPLCLMATGALCINFKMLPVLKADALLIFIVMLSYAIGIILLALLISVLVKSAKLGSVLVLLAQTAGFVVTIVLDTPNSSNYVNISAFVKLATSMYSPCGIYWAFKLIVAWEKRQIGASWSNLFEYAIEGDNITLGSVLLMMISSWILWAIVILYLDAIVPWQYGMPKNPLFFVRGSYWFPNRVAADQLELVQLEDSTSSSEDDMVEKTNGNNAVIRLNRITHNFGPLRAVDDLSLELYGNQITVLLGHNGAGKTTAMNILTGLFPPSRGDIFIHGYDVRKNTKKAREGVGLCPQHNVLFDDLTVEEHLHFFAMLKSSNAVDSEVRDLMSKLELTAKKSTLAKSLSGGMKRKLSLANAMVGDSSVLILDEPSSGLDPEARRVVWDLLQQERTRRTVLMTTHYMEEADALGDRIAFLAKGKLMCAGSPMFLKRKFETGYKLRLTKVDQGLDPAPILDTIKSLLPQNADNVHLVSNMSYEIIINIGFPGSVQMIALFRHLESNQRQLGIESLGTSVTTMEDVFLKVGQREEDLASNNDKKLETSVNVFESFPKFQRLTGASLILRQMLAIFVMRFHSIRRDPKIIAYVTLLPLVFALLLSLIVTPGDGITRYKPITYDVKKLLSGPEAFLAGGGDDPVAKEFKNLLRKRGLSFSELPKLSTKEELDNYFLEQAKKDPARYKLRSYAGMLENSPSIYFNGQPYHIGAAAIADWQAATLKSLTRVDGQVTITNHPLDEKTREPPIKSKIEGMRFLSVLFMSLIFSCVSCAVIITPIQERVRKSKLIQVMSGVRPVVYIGSNFLFDGVLMLTAMLLCLILMLCFNPMSGFTNLGETIPSILLIFILFIFASTPWAYIVSYLFTSSTTGFSVYLAVNIVAVFIAGLIFSILEGFVNVVGNKADVYIHILNFIPVFSASWSFSTTYRNGCVKTAFDALGAKKLCDFTRSFLNPSILVFCRFGENGTWEYGEHSVFNMNLFVGIGFQLIASAVMGVVGSVLVVLIEMNSRRFAHVADSINLKKLFSCAKGSSQDQNTREVIEDSAVQEERQAVYDIVATNKIATKALVAKDVTKSYGSLRAVNNVSFHVEKNECFGLLGVNGAGKTTTFSMLTGDYMMSKGNSYIQNTDVTSKLQAYQEYIGYCPQFDALADTLTGREMLSLFCGLRGVPTDQVDVMIDFMTTMADLKPHINKLTQTYSGGNKRKLSLAIAMIGNPPLLFLDEPSAGVDPGARRKIWATLAQAQKELNSSVVLTSHSMDECEALCHRLVIMLRGTFRCLGSSQQIKSRYGEGFTVMIKTKAIEHDQKDAVYESMRHLFDGRCELKDSYQCLLQFHVNDSNLRWSEVFERIERLRENPQLQLEDVQVSDTTLEQVFLNFAKEDVAKPQGQQGTTNHAFAV